MIDIGFIPDGARAREIDFRMRKSLGESLAHVCERAKGIVPFDEAALFDLARSLGRGHRHPPLAFGWYFCLVDAILAARYTEAETILQTLSSLPPVRDTLDVVAFANRKGDGIGSLYLDLIMMDEEQYGDGLLPPEGDQAALFSNRLHETLALLDEALPELAGEVRALVMEIILASGDAAAPVQFDGAACHRLWGALFINPQFHRTRLQLAEVLAHESGHLLLFGFEYDEPLVRNRDEEVYPSPLRGDPRPMDGVFHATYVSARMYLTMRALAGYRGLSEAERAAALDAADADRRNFFAGEAIVAAHGRLSETGRALFEEARAFMHNN